jgi:DNA-binding MarR family transcriptional regulator
MCLRHLIAIGMDVPKARHAGGSTMKGKDVTGEIDRALVRIKRTQTRKALGRRAGQLAVVDAVEEGPEQPDEEVTVGLIGERLGVDPSRASRAVAGAIRSGLLRRVASQSDARRVGLVVTGAGRDALKQIHRVRHRLIESATADWPERDRRALAALLTRFTQGLARSGRGLTAGRQG